MGEESKYNDGHAIEACDRCHTIGLMIDELLSGHLGIIEADAQLLVEQAADLIGQIYQKVGQLD